MKIKEIEVGVIYGYPFDRLTEDGLQKNILLLVEGKVRQSYKPNQVQVNKIAFKDWQFTKDNKIKNNFVVTIEEYDAR